MQNINTGRDYSSNIWLHDGVTIEMILLKSMKSKYSSKFTQLSLRAHNDVSVS